MLTGDSARSAQAITEEAGVDDSCANLKPEDKVAKVRELAARYGHVAKVGDAVNDARLWLKLRSALRWARLEQMSPWKRPTWRSWSTTWRSWFTL